VAFTVRKLFLPPQVNTTTFPFPKGIYGCVNAWSGCHGVTALQPVVLLWLWGCRITAACEEQNMGKFLQKQWQCLCFCLFLQTNLIHCVYA
jgi:hypothetical protein